MPQKLKTKKKITNPYEEESHDSHKPLDWDFYFYVGCAILHWSHEDFLNSTPRLLLSQYIAHLRYTNPDALIDESKPKIYSLDQTPFM